MKEGGREKGRGEWLTHIYGVGYGKTIAKVLVTLKTIKGTKQLRLDPRFSFLFPPPSQS